MFSRFNRASLLVKNKILLQPRYFHADHKFEYNKKTDQCVGEILGFVLAIYLNEKRIENTNKYVLDAKIDKIEMPKYPLGLHIITGLLYGIGGSLIGATLGGVLTVTFSIFGFGWNWITTQSEQYDKECEMRYTNRPRE
jgi:hypothetical protein